MKLNKSLSHKELKALAPSIFTKTPASRLSDKYHQVRTIDAIDVFQEEGWRPIWADQKRSRHGQDIPYAKHLVRFRHESVSGIFKGGGKAIGQAFPEIVLSNSHNGSSCYRLLAGIYVVACSNGLIVAEETIGSVIIRHLQANSIELIAAATSISNQTKPVITRVHAMRDRVLTPEEAKAFAQSALEMKFPSGNSPFKPEHVLAARREEDDREDLWAVFNRAQENLMAGGTVGVTTGDSGRRFTSSPVRNINALVRYNQSLWALADQVLAG